MLAIADAFADAGFVVVAIDQPLHGLTSTTNPLYARPANPLYGGTAPAGATSYERTFDLDLINNTSGATGPDGVVDPSGTHFINLSSVLTSRDNLRQAATDLLTLTRAVPGLDFNADGTADINAGAHPLRRPLARRHRRHCVCRPAVGRAHRQRRDARRRHRAAAARVARRSARASPPASSPRASRPGTTLFDQFFRDAQTAVDSGDPLNYVTAAVALRPYHLIQIVGGGAVLPDQVVPNSATQRLITAAAIPKVATAGANAVSRGYVNFIVGDHGSILSPAASLAATVEIQRQIVTFAASDGTTILISNPAVIQP